MAKSVIKANQGVIQSCLCVDEANPDKDTTSAYYIEIPRNAKNVVVEAHLGSGEIDPPTDLDLQLWGRTRLTAELESGFPATSDAHFIEVEGALMEDFEDTTKQPIMLEPTNFGELFDRIYCRQDYTTAGSGWTVTLYCDFMLE